MSRRSLGWTACVVGRGPSRRVAIAQPGDPLYGYRVVSDRSEERVAIVVDAVTVPAPDRSRIPAVGTPVGMRRLASTVLDRLDAREVRA